MAEAALDTLAVIETPEGVTLRLVPAGMVVRLLALMVDLLVLGFAQGALALVLSALGGLGGGAMMIIGFFAQWLYPVAFEVLNAGQTLGKHVLGLQVVHDDGTPVRLPASVVRNLLRAVDMLPGTGTVAFMSMLIDPRFRRVGDRAAGTMVVYKPAQAFAAHEDLGSPLPLPLPLSVEEQRLLVAFAERRRFLSMDRARELAALVQPLTGAHADNGIEVLQRMAQGILGSR